MSVNGYVRFHVRLSLYFLFPAVHVRLKSLKVKIAITLALLLLVAIGLTNFVLFRLIERNIIDTHFTFGKNWIEAMHHADPVFQEQVTALSGYEKSIYPGIIYANVNERSEGLYFADADVDIIDRHARTLLAHVKNTGEPAHLFAGREWGIFWKRGKYLVIGAPLPDGSGAGIVAMALGADYRMLRNAQQAAMGYLLLNFLILFGAGVYRFTGLVIRPVHRFIRLTDNYRYSEPFDLFPEKQHDEFSRLSSSLNRMMHRIEDDRHELEQSIKKIETANRDLKKAQQEIIRAEKLASIGRLSAGIAHEIGNPIGIVLGYLGLLKSRSISSDDKNGIDYITRAEAEINRINNIIRQLLDFSRSTTCDFAEFSVHDLLYDTGRMIAQQPLMENIRLYFDFSSADDIVYADYHQMHQVIVNLVINAADSIPCAGNSNQGEIRLVTADAEDGNWFQLEIKDNGCGFPVDNMDKVFDPFFTTKETGKGTGLGLYVSYMIIERFGGSISIQNNKDGGASIVIRLPRADKRKCGYDS